MVGNLTNALLVADGGNVPIADRDPLLPFDAGQASIAARQ